MDSATRTSWEGQTAVITGGADGLGLALGKRLKEEGVRVAVFDFDVGKLEQANELFGKENCFQIDVTAAGEVRKAVGQVLDQTGSIEILVNCAGITGATKIRSHEVEPADFQRVLRVNVEGCLFTAQAVLPGMVERGYGRILHIASIAGKEGNAGMLAYSTSKAAVIGMTKVMGKEYATDGITINCLAPAVIQTRMVEMLPEEQVKYMTDKIPMNRCGTLEEFAATAAWIVSPANSFSTGFCYDLSGGRAVY